MTTPLRKPYVPSPLGLPWNNTTAENILHPYKPKAIYFPEPGPSRGVALSFVVVEEEVDPSPPSPVLLAQPHSAVNITYSMPKTIHPHLAMAMAAPLPTSMEPFYPYGKPADVHPFNHRLVLDTHTNTTIATSSVLRGTKRAAETAGLISGRDEMAKRCKKDSDKENDHVWTSDSARYHQESTQVRTNDFEFWPDSVMECYEDYQSLHMPTELLPGFNYQRSSSLIP